MLAAKKLIALWIASRMPRDIRNSANIAIFDIEKHERSQLACRRKHVFSNIVSC